jgi:hypothetical protein
MAIVEHPAPNSWAGQTQVPPHTYPVWVVGAAVLVVIAALYSFAQVQTLIDGTGNFRAGQRALAARDYTAAMVQLEAAHEQVPSSRKVTIYLATAEFGANDQQDALALINGMRFSRSEWSVLTQTMPPSIQAQYHLTN